MEEKDLIQKRRTNILKKMRCLAKCDNNKNFLEGIINLENLIKSFRYPFWEGFVTAIVLTMDCYEDDLEEKKKWMSTYIDVCVKHQIFSQKPSM